MTPDQERWAEALAIERMHGADATRWIAGRIAALPEQGDIEGVERFREIAARMERLMVADPTTTSSTRTCS